MATRTTDFCFGKDIRRLTTRRLRIASGLSATLPLRLQIVGKAPSGCAVIRSQSGNWSSDRLLNPWRLPTIDLSKTQVSAHGTEFKRAAPLVSIAGRGEFSASISSSFSARFFRKSTAALALRAQCSDVAVASEEKKRERVATLRKLIANSVS